MPCRSKTRSCAGSRRPAGRHAGTRRRLDIQGRAGARCLSAAAAVDRSSGAGIVGGAVAAGVAEWQTRQTQNLLSERTWEFKSPRPHQQDQSDRLIVAYSVEAISGICPYHVPSCGWKRFRVHARPMAGSPLKRQRQLGVRVRDEDGSVNASRACHAFADLSREWRHFSTAEKIEHLIGIGRCRDHHPPGLPVGHLHRRRANRARSRSHLIDDSSNREKPFPRCGDTPLTSGSLTPSTADSTSTMCSRRSRGRSYPFRRLPNRPSCTTSRRFGGRNA
jgi:hypothetical protein